MDKLESVLTDFNAAVKSAYITGDDTVIDCYYQKILNVLNQKKFFSIINTFDFVPEYSLAMSSFNNSFKSFDISYLRRFNVDNSDLILRYKKDALVALADSNIHDYYLNILHLHFLECFNEKKNPNKMDCLCRFSSDTRSYFVPKLLSESEYDGIYSRYFGERKKQVFNSSENIGSIIGLIVREPLKTDFFEMTKRLNELSFSNKNDVILKLNDMLRNTENCSSEMFYLTALKYALVGDKDVNCVFYYKNALEYVLKDCQLHNNLVYYKSKYDLISDLVNKLLCAANNYNIEVDVSDFLKAYNFRPELIYSLVNGCEEKKIKYVYDRRVPLSKHLSIIDRIKGKIRGFLDNFSLGKTKSLHR